MDSKLETLHSLIRGKGKEGRANSKHDKRTIDLQEHSFQLFEDVQTYGGVVWNCVTKRSEEVHV